MSNILEYLKVFEILWFARIKATLVVSIFEALEPQFILQLPVSLSGTLRVPRR
jgi:hypothetical protein